MKNPVLIFAGMLMLLCTMSEAGGQDIEKKSDISVTADFYSNYVWRGTRFGQGPHLQPGIKFTTGGLTAGIWGSFDVNGYSEADPYISYTFPVGLSIGIADYYYPGLPVFDFSRSDGSHAIEINTGFTKGGLTLSANYILNEAGGAGSFGGDMYFQAGYAFTRFNIWAGAGNGWHTSSGDFALCNLGFGTGKTIEITEKFSIPVTGQVILNPEREEMFLVIGFTF